MDPAQGSARGKSKLCFWELYVLPPNIFDPQVVRPSDAKAMNMEADCISQPLGDAQPTYAGVAVFVTCACPCLRCAQPLTSDQPSEVLSLCDTGTDLQRLSSH